MKLTNLTRSGCTTTIEMGLLAIEGVRKAHVEATAEEVEIAFEDGTDLNNIRKKLMKMGYPQKDNE